LSLARMDEMALWTFVRVCLLLMFEHWPNSSRS